MVTSIHASIIIIIIIIIIISLGISLGLCPCVWAGPSARRTETLHRQEAIDNWDVGDGQVRR